MRAYRVLLRCYPAGFRDEYGEELCRTFAQRRRRAASRFAVLALWSGAIVDVARNAAVVHADILRQDLRFALRSLRRAPGFAITALAVTALGVGANTAVFSVADRALARQLPYPDSERLVELWQGESPYRNEVSPPNFRDWRDRNKAFEVTGAYHFMAANLVGKTAPVRLDGAAVTGELLPMLGARPAVGRLFTPGDFPAAAPGTLVLSHGAWQRLYGGDPGILGSAVRLDETAYTIIGVMPASFTFPRRDTQMWVPMRILPEDDADRTNTYLHVVAKLRPGVTLEAARAEMDVVARQLEREYPEENERVGVLINALRDQASKQSRLLLLALLGAALCVLLIACANLGSLLLARAMGRAKELTMRTALGAGRERLTRQLLTEALALAALGGLLGLLVAMAVVPLLRALVPAGLPVSDATALDPRVLVFAAAITTATGIAFGVLPALGIGRIGRAERRGDRADLPGLDGLRQGSRAGGSRQRSRLRSVLVAVEVAACVVLLVAAGLLLRALWRVQSTDPGYRTAGVLAIQTPLPAGRYEITARRAELYSRVLAETRALPGVENAAYISHLPIVQGGFLQGVSIGGSDRDGAGGERRTASMRFVSSGFFDTLGIPLRAGRDVADSDTIDSNQVAVVSESFGRRFLEGRDPLGQRFGFAGAERTIVGVVSDIRVRGLERDSEPQVYLPVRQVPDNDFIGYRPKELVVRSTLPTGALVTSVRGILQRADPELPLAEVRPLGDTVRADSAPRRTQIAVLGTFAGLSLLLAGVGIYGLLALSVSQRLTEFSVRLAVGARASDILKLVLRQSLGLAVLGTTAGLAVAYAAGRSLEALLAGIRPGDLPTFAAAAGIALLAALAGSLAPMWRAVRVEPVSALRSE